MSENPEYLPTGGQETSQEVVGGGAELDGFDGNQTTRLDERGRLKIPVEFREFIDRKYGKGFKTFHITSIDGTVAELYPMPEWSNRRKKMMALPQSSEARDRYLIYDSLYGANVDADPQGRLPIPQELREDADLTLDVKVYGAGNHLRITSVRKLRELARTKPILPQHKDEMKNLGC